MTVAACLLPACAAGGASDGRPQLTVFAAESLTEVFGEIAGEFERRQAEAGRPVEVILNVAGSSALATQIEEGAPADVFASADLRQMERLGAAGLIAGEPSTFARNTLVVVTARDGAGIEEVKDLARPGVRLVIGTPDVPAGRYAREIVDRLASDPALGEDWRATVLGNVVSFEPNVRSVLAKVQLGDADAGFVYRTDARIAGDEVRVIEIPAGASVAAEYPIAVVRASQQQETARAFVEFVRGPEGQRILRAGGFDVGP